LGVGWSSSVSVSAASRSRTPEGGVQIEFDSKEEGERLAMEVVIPPGEDDVASEFWAFPE
jgi:hypothetical protein